MNGFRDVMRRPDYGISAIVPVEVFIFAWWMGWGVFVAIGSFVAAAIVTATLRPRRPGRWTE